MEQEGELQICRKILNEIAKNPDPLQVKWDSIKAAVLRSKPLCAPTAPFLFQFVIRYGGGSGGQYIHRTDSYVRACGKPSLGSPGKSEKKHLYISLGGRVRYNPQAIV